MEDVVVHELVNCPSCEYRYPRSERVCVMCGMTAPPLINPASVMEQPPEKANTARSELVQRLMRTSGHAVSQLAWSICIRWSELCHSLAALHKRWVEVFSDFRTKSKALAKYDKYAGTAAVLISMFVLVLAATKKHSPIHSAKASSTSATVQQPAENVRYKPKDTGLHVHSVRQTQPVALSKSSHRQITDRVAATALQQLTPFEIASLNRKADYGDDSAAFLLGMAFETGYGVPASCTTAGEWVSKAAQWGNAAAQYNLGLRYRDGDGVAPNPAEAERWMRRANAQGYSDARVVLAALVTTGEHGSSQDKR